MKTDTMPQSVSDFYENMETRSDMSFQGLPHGETCEMTHCYHPYPAKFIPQLVKQLITEFTKEDDYVWDPFCGSGTLNVEAFRAKRNSLGSDINPVAILISRSKTTPLVPEELHHYREAIFSLLEHRKVRSLGYYVSRNILNGNQAELDRWFPKENLKDLAEILRIIKTHKSGGRLQNFALCCFSSILKRCSNWLRTSVKPQIDPSRNPARPTNSFMQQFRRMERANERFYKETTESDSRTSLLRHNAKSSLPRGYRREYDAIITSPPYLISYEYSDIFRLSSYLLFYREDYDRFKSGFIGTRRKKRICRKPIMKGIDALGVLGDWKDVFGNRSADPIMNYYSEMALFIQNVRSYLSDDGKLILVVGDPSTKSLQVPNAYILSEIAKGYGLRLSRQLRREISGKHLPTYRDRETGRFSSKSNPNKVKAHEEEYILVFKEGFHGRGKGNYQS